MGRIAPPLLFSAAFSIDPAELRGRGVLDPALNVDTKLFIDPLLLPFSRYDAFASSGWKRYEEHFGRVISALSKSEAIADRFWIIARRLLQFREIKWTCLGYGAATISGSGSGKLLTDAMMQSAQAIIRHGIDDPELFLAFPLFEDGIGPDRISDMTTNVIAPEIVSFTASIAKELEVPTRLQHLSTIGAGRLSAELPWNHLAGGPVLLLPEDVLRALPISTDWGAIADNVENVASDVSRHIIELWQTKSSKSKADLKEAVLRDAKTARWLLDTIASIDPKSYNFSVDPEYEVLWRELGERVASSSGIQIRPPLSHTKEELLRVVSDIVATFRFLVEERRLSEELYLPDGRTRTEKAAQRLFFAVAYAHCKANNIDITPEADTGNGPVDFKFSSGFAGRVVVEIKLSKGKVVSGFERQIAKYAAAEETDAAIYLVLDVGGLGEKLEAIFNIRNAAAQSGRRVASIELIDATRRLSASKLA